VHFALTVLFGVVLAIVMSIASGSLVSVNALLTWTSINLGLSAPVFLILTALGWSYVHRLKDVLAKSHTSPARIAHLEQRVDLIVALLFGVGVLYTAVGLRAALVQAIDTPSGQSASDMLTALVNGGILSAMTSTIVGGVLGYGLRMVKLFRVGHALDVYYAEKELQAITRREDLLKEILSELQRGNVKYGG
jgi:hypothetical protein